MITINIIDNDSICLTGHSLPDICAGVSCIMYTTINALMRYNEDCISFADNGEHMILAVEKHDDIIDMLFDNMCNMLYDLQSDCEQYITINKTEN